MREGILRLNAKHRDLLSNDLGAIAGLLFDVGTDRPAFRRIQDLEVRYLSYGELERNREQMARFGAGLRPIEAIARRLT